VVFHARNQLFVIRPHASCVWSDVPTAEPKPVDVIFQSTLPVWGATNPIKRDFDLMGISIHAPRVGSDDTLEQMWGHGYAFQSTLPVWGATRVLLLRGRGMGYFNPRPPCGERPVLCDNLFFFVVISIHAPRVGSDLNAVIYARYSSISIHAPRVGSDGDKRLF